MTELSPHELAEFYRPTPPPDHDIAQVKALVREIKELIADQRADAPERDRQIRARAEARKRGRL